MQKLQPGMLVVGQPSQLAIDPSALTMVAVWLFLAVAMETRMGRLLMTWPDISVSERSLSASLPKRTNPYPFERPVKGSVITCTAPRNRSQQPAFNGMQMILSHNESQKGTAIENGLQILLPKEQEG